MRAAKQILVITFGLLSPLAWSQSAPLPTNLSGDEAQPCVTGFLPGPRAQYEADEQLSAARDPFYDSEVPGPSFNDGVEPELGGY